MIQVFNLVFFFFAAVYLFLPSFWLTMLIVLYEGLVGGGVYVNAFYAIPKEVPKNCFSYMIHLITYIGCTSGNQGSIPHSGDF